MDAWSKQLLERQVCELHKTLQQLNLPLKIDRSWLKWYCILTEYTVKARINCLEITTLKLVTPARVETQAKGKSDENLLFEFAFMSENLGGASQVSFVASEVVLFRFRSCELPWIFRYVRAHKSFAFLHSNISESVFKYSRGEFTTPHSAVSTADGVWLMSELHTLIVL